MSDKLRAYLQLHFCVLIWGFTAVLGELISIEAIPLVWWRVVLCCAGLLFFFPLSALRAIKRPMLWRLLGIGLIVGVHWICFYGAVKLANASVAVVAMATTTFFSALTEPYLMKQRIKWYELAIGILILPGMWLCVENIDLSMKGGFLVGILGAFLAAVFSVLNKKTIEMGAPPALVMTFVELSGVAILTTVLMPFFLYFSQNGQFIPPKSDILWLCLLAWGCTLLPFALSLKAMRHLTAFASNLTINLEPVYGVILAGLILNEHKTLPDGFYWGVAIIMLAVFGHPFIKSYFEKNSAAVEKQPVS